MKRVKHLKHPTKPAPLSVDLEFAPCRHTHSIVVGFLQLQEEIEPARDEWHASLWGAAVGAPLYVRASDPSDN
jgi:hypothetical protein